MAEQTTATIEDDEQHEVVVNTWEFLDRVPTREDVIRLLETLPDVWGVRPVSYVEYVQPLPQSKKVKRPHPTRPDMVVDDRIDAYTMYVSVAGRLRMLNDAQAVNGWRVDVRPEPVTPTGVPGYLQMDERLVYRVYVEIFTPIDVPRAVSEGTGMGLVEVAEWLSLGVRSGTAWVPASGGSNAAGSNPYEKVETSALGRALAGWGFGLLPGSGIASVEEMAQMRENNGQMRVEQARRGAAPRKSREDLLQETLALGEELRIARGVDEQTWTEQVGQHLRQRLGVRDAWDDRENVIDWSRVKDGQLTLVANGYRANLRQIADRETGL